MRSMRRTSVEKRNVMASTTSTSTLNSKSAGEINKDQQPTVTQHQFTLTSPRHISISYASTDHDLIYESVILFYSLAAFFLQLLHLYRTVWWLPQSYEQNAVKFYLVNPYIIGYVLTLIGSRWLWACFKTLIVHVFPMSWQQRTQYYSQIVTLACLGFAHFYCISLIASEETSEEESFFKTNRTYRMSCLLYPTFVMTTTYQEDLKSYVELVPEREEPLHVTHSSLHTSLNVKHKCSGDPVLVRQEVEWLRQDFNHRLRNVLFHSHTIAVVCALLPCCIAQTFVHFDFYVVIQHFLLVWAGSLTLNAVHAFPSKYCDVLHSSARHLGYWDHVGTDSSHSNLQYVEWCPNTIWKQGALVRSDNEIYRARSDVNSAEPGSIHHERFYALFINAALFQIGLLVFQLTLVLLQLILLFRSTEWYQMISLSLLQASSGYALFKLMRDAVVVWRLSLAEEMMKPATPNQS